MTDDMTNRINEMLKKYTAEEWKKLIKEEMDKLGLYFVDKDTESHDYEPLFSENTGDINVQDSSYYRS